MGSSYAYDRMFLSICKAVFSTLLTEFIENRQYLSIKPMTSRNATYKDVSLMIFKGSNIKAEAYKGISQTIQEIGNERGLNIDIKIPYIARWHMNEMKKPFFALGHSSGVYDILSFHNITKYNGLIQIGSVLNSNGKLPWKSERLDKFPVPVLTMVGKKDGYLRYIYCLDEMYTQNDIEKYKTKPVIILKDINHLHISNTSSSQIAKWLGLKDLQSDMNTKQAWKILGSSIVDFIVLNIGNSSHSAKSLKRMKIKQNDTRHLLDMYLRYDNRIYISNILHTLQRQLLNKSESDIKFYNYYDFLFSKPRDDLMTCYIQDKNHLFSKMYYTPLWVKTKYEFYISAKQMQERIFFEIANSLKINTKLKLIFKEDKRCITTLEWICSGVTIERKDDTYYIQGPIFITNENMLVPFKNYYYFKILSPAQMVELMQIDLQDY